MKSAIPFLASILIASADAALIYESAVVATSDTGFGYDNNFYLASHFTLSSTVNVTSVGGNFMYTTGSSFAAIVAVPDRTSYPTFEPEMIVSNALAHSVFSTPPGNNFDDIDISMTVTLPAGEYALVIGSGAFGASGQGALTAYQQPWFLDHMFYATYSITNGGVVTDQFWQGGGTGDPYSEVRSEGVRFFVNGDGPAFVPPRATPYIPEPATITLCGIGALLLARRRRI
jgi:hypothetical protein